MVKQSLENNLKESFQAVGGVYVKKALPKGAEQSPGASSGEQKEHLMGETLRTIITFMARVSTEVRREAGQDAAMCSACYSCL